MTGSKVLRVAPSGAMVNVNSIDAIYINYEDGSDAMEVIAVVGGVDIVLIIIPANPADITPARNAAEAFMKKFANECCYIVR